MIMAITTIRKADIVAGVPKAWERQYADGRGPDAAEKQAITSRLKALPIGFTASDVKEIIGNSSWTDCRCDECGIDSDVLVRIGEDCDYHTRWVYVCRTCLDRAVLAAVAGAA